MPGEWLIGCPVFYWEQSVSFQDTGFFVVLFCFSLFSLMVAWVKSSRRLPVQADRVVIEVSDGPEVEHLVMSEALALRLPCRLSSFCVLLLSHGYLRGWKIALHQFLITSWVLSCAMSLWYLFLCFFPLENVGSRKEPFEKVQRVDGCVQGPTYGFDALVERGRVCPGYVSVQLPLGLLVMGCSCLWNPCHSLIQPFKFYFVFS